MKKETKELIDKMKNAILSGEYSLCDNRWWCPLKDGYCPKYSCRQLDMIKAYTDRQWENGIKYARDMYGDNFVGLRDLINVVLNEYLWEKQPSNARRTKK